jgi:hypothetical protein
LRRDATHTAFELAQRRRVRHCAAQTRAHGFELFTRRAHREPQRLHFAFDFARGLLAKGVPFALEFFAQGPLALAFLLGFARQTFELGAFARQLA